MHQSTLKTITGWTIIAFIIFSTWLIHFFKELNYFFLALLAFEIVLAIRFRKGFSPQMLRFIQIILGLLFMFSGFVKGVDPMGTAYRIEDYFAAFQTEWANPLALFLSFIMNASEFVLGALLLLNIKPKITIWLVVLMMILFTITTINDAINNPVPDCGCFGDAIILSNWQTFYKNLVIDALILILLLNSSRLKAFFQNLTELSLAGAVIVLFLGFEYYNYANLPVIDFMPWKVGNKAIPDNPQPIKYYLSYQNKSTGEIKEYLSPDYPYNDSVWVANWQFVNQRVENPNKVPGMDLAIIDMNGTDVTSGYLENPDYYFFAVAWDLNSSSKSALKTINGLYQKAESNNLSFIVLTASLPEEIEKIKSENSLSDGLEFFNSDDVILKTMVRANPGLMLMKDGQVIAKWHYNNFPEWEELEEDLLKSRN